LAKPNWLSLSQAVDALADELGICSGRDGIGANPRALSELVAALADGQLSAEGVPADRPLEYESIPDAWWTMTIPDGLLVVDRGRMPAEPQEVTIVNFGASAIRRIADGAVIIYRSVRIRSEAIRNIKAGDSPIRIENTPPPIERYHSGLSGRPTARGLIEREMRRRGRCGELLPSLAKEAAYLASWCKEKHPDAPSVTAKTIRNSLAGLYRQMPADVPLLLKSVTK
jgi:hypothetical protein